MALELNPFEVFFTKWAEVESLFEPHEAAEMAEAAISASVEAMSRIKAPSPCQCGNPMCDLRWRKLLSGLAMHLAACNEISEVLQMLDDGDLNPEYNRKVLRFIEIVRDRENWPRKTPEMIEALHAKAVEAAKRSMHGILAEHMGEVLKDGL